MLKKIRVVTAVISFIIITFLFLDFTGTLHSYFGWIAKLQFIPALLAVNVGVVILLIALTLILGRIYCSVICPLGIFQDIISWLAGKRKKNRFKYLPPINWLRYGVLMLFILSLVLGISSIFSLLDPYGAYGRIASNLVSPIYKLGNNILASIAEIVDSYSFYGVDIWIKSGLALTIASATIVVVGLMAWSNGRLYCNTVCPVGTVLGLFSKYSFLKPVIDLDKCNECRLCSRSCKASCIDSENHKIDYNRCVACFDCIETCSKDAIKFIPYNKANSNIAAKPGEGGAEGRRNFLTIAAVLSLSKVLRGQEKNPEGVLAPLKDRNSHQRMTQVCPAGSLCSENLTKHCTSCGLCISVCPNNVLSPSNNLINFLQPQMSFEKGYCRPECVKCTEVCPTSSINKLSLPQKSSIKIGSSIWIRDYCVVITDNVNCGNCSRHCPAGAIQMVPKDPDNNESLKIPAIDTEKCIGCGACEYLCPARPYSAIYVEGIEKHRTI